MIDKILLLEAVVQYFEEEHEVLVRAARATYEAATHEENKAENKYDTRGLEASYLAESQSKRALELQQTVNIYKSMSAKTFSKDDIIATGALVVLNDGIGDHHYFLGPRGGGSSLHLQKREITIITPASPLGRSLMGKEVGDELEVGPAQNPREYTVTGLY